MGLWAGSRAIAEVFGLLHGRLSCRPTSRREVSRAAPARVGRALERDQVGERSARVALEAAPSLGLRASPSAASSSAPPFGLSPSPLGRGARREPPQLDVVPLRSQTAVDDSPFCSLVHPFHIRTNFCPGIPSEPMDAGHLILLNVLEHGMNPAEKGAMGSRRETYHSTSRDRVFSANYFVDLIVAYHE